MKATTIGLVISCALGCCAAVRAQEFEEQLAAVDLAIEDGAWQEALGLLLPLVGKAEREEDLDALFGRLTEVASTMVGAGDVRAALPAFEASLAVMKRLHGDRDHEEVLTVLRVVASGYQAIGSHEAALRSWEAVLGMQQRLFRDRDSPDVAMVLNNVGACLRSLDRAEDALPRFEASLAMRMRLHGDRDHPDVAMSLRQVASCLESLGRVGEALPKCEAALAMLRRLHGDRDHPAVAAGLNEVAGSLRSLGRASEALSSSEAALAMLRRLHGDRDHPLVAAGLNNVASLRGGLGRESEALPEHEAALAMRRRLYGETDHPDTAGSLNNLASCLHELGRAEEALPVFEAALAMLRRLHGERDQPDVANALHNVAGCLNGLGRAKEALPLFEAALAMQKRLHSNRDHPQVAAELNAVAVCLSALHRSNEALPLCEAALAMHRRLYGDHDHPVVANSLNNVAACLNELGRTKEASPVFEATLAMQQRLHGDRDHPDTVKCLSNVAAGLQLLGRAGEALLLVEQAVAMSERLRDRTLMSPRLRQSFFEKLKEGGVFEQLQALASRLGRSADALHAAERSRGRDLLDQLTQTGDPDAEAERRARLRGDEAAANRLAALRTDIDASRAESDRLLHELTRLADLADDAERTTRREALLAQSNAVSTMLRQLLDERARLLRDVLPVGRVRTAAEIQSALQDGELLLEFTVTEGVALLYVLARDGDVQAVELPQAFATSQRVLPALLQRTSRTAVRGRDPEAAAAGAPAEAASRELLASLVPAAVWERIRACKRVFVAAHRELHRLPFELLVTEVKDGKAVHWLDSGPPVSYVPSGTMLHWLRMRQGASQAPTLDVVAIGDPKVSEAPSAPGAGADAARFVHHDDLERLRQLPQLVGARAEAEAIAAAFRGKDGMAELLLGERATEPAVTDLAAKAKYLHFACHGIAEEYAGQSLSMLVLTQPKDLAPGDDGFLKLGDLFQAWSGRLDGCRLVTLSACRTNVGPTLRDEAPQALPIGFLFAGAPAVISSLWAVDDASTKELMVDFYARLLAGETDRLAAFTAAKKALRAKYPDPFHWAPFLYLGAPE